MSKTLTGRRIRSNSGTAIIEFGVFIGRFQFLHNGHLFVIREALKRVNRLIILVGSSNTPRSYFNPFSFAERRAMIMASLTEEERARVVCMALEDFTYNNTRWITEVQQQVENAIIQMGEQPTDSVALVGHEKDGTGFYLKMFPQWESISVPSFGKLSATPLREQFFLTDDAFTLDQVPQPVIDFLDQFGTSADYEEIEAEYKFVEDYKRPFKKLKYPPVFITVDAVVVQAGNILLVERGGRPGKGLWALPGGFLNTNERIVDAVYRELREETKIAVPEPVLRGSTKAWEVFDAVHRSSRGRTITHAALISLEGSDELPRIKGSDDAKTARWYPLKGAGAIHRDQMFEDHMSIIMAMIAKL
jgi:bifunctional NMN adenylyltransferase/nudix hydrolase